MIEWPELPYYRCGRRMVKNLTDEVYECTRQRGHIYWVHNEPIPVSEVIHLTAKSLNLNEWGYKLMVKLITEVHKVDTSEEYRNTVLNKSSRKTKKAKESGQTETR
jgi:hypothetical protein